MVRLAASDEWPAVPEQARRSRRKTNMYWLVLIVSGLFEAVWAVALANSNGLRRPVWVVVFVVTLIMSMTGLGFALKALPVGTAYAIWTGIGAVTTAVVGMIFLHEPVSVARIVCLVLIIAGIVGLRALN